MSKEEKKPGFLQRLLGFGAAKPKGAELAPEAISREPAKKAPPRAKPANKPAQPKHAPKKSEAAKAPKRSQSPKAHDPAAEVRKQKAEAPSAATKLKVPPPAGPAALPGVRPPDERQLGTRKKGTPEHELGALSPGAEPGTDAQVAEAASWPAPPAQSPDPAPADEPEKGEGQGPTTPASEPPAKGSNS
jgi:hypothetical protein